MDRLFLLLDKALFVLTLYIPDVSLVPDLTMQLRALFGIASKQLPLELSGARPQMARFSHRFSPPRFLSKLS
jgi:hypothetical protein